MFLLAIAGIIAAGALIAYAVVLTIRWVKDKIKEFIAKKNVKKVAVTKLKKLIEECPNQKTLDDLLNDDYDTVFATVNENDEVQDVEIVKNTGYDDPEVDRMLGEGEMVVVTR